MSINHDDVLDLRDLAGEAEYAADVLSDEEDYYTEDERVAALQDLNAFAKLATEIGLTVDRENWATVAEELKNWGENYEPALIAEDYFEEYTKELTVDLGYLPRDLDPLIADNIDWEGVASTLEADYRDVEFDGVTYKIREA